MTKDKALKMALKAFEWNYNTDLDNIPACEKWAKMLKENITAIKEALAQPEQPKVRTGDCLLVGVCASEGHKIQAKQEQEEYLSKAYRLANELRCHLAIAPAPQRTWVGLTDEELPTLAGDNGKVMDLEQTRKFYKVIERLLKEKNT